jgi:predicted Zn-dependent protease
LTIVKRGLALLLLFLWLAPNAARAQGLSLIRDTEIEDTIRVYATPILEAAGLQPEAVNLVIVNANVVNAFVAGGQNIFLYTGLILETENPGELIGVIAHETGHIAGGHLLAGREAMSKASMLAVLGTLLGVAGAVASGNSDVAVGAIAGGQEAAMRSFFAFSRGQEAAADQAALTFLDRVGWSAQGLASFFEKLGVNELLPSREAEYVRTHPLTRDRIQAVEAGISRSPFARAPLPPAFYTRYATMKAKLIGYLAPDQALRLYPAENTAPDARYARAIALFRIGSVERSLKLFDGLIEEFPDNAYYREMKAQVLFENGRIADSVPYYREAAAALPQSGLVRLSLAHALIETYKPEVYEEALANLKQVEKLEPLTSFTHRLMATVYGRMGNEPMARLHLAEESYLDMDLWQARQHAQAAVKTLPSGSPGRIRAQDILLMTEGADVQPPRRPR